MDKDENGSSFHVKDKRRFNVDGSKKDEADDSGETSHSAEPEIKDTKSSDQTHVPEIDFVTFMLSLASSAQISLGLIAHPVTKKPEVNLVGAKQTIDILGMIEAKTKGNLTPEEESILKQILFELRMHYVEMVNKAKEKKN